MASLYEKNSNGMEIYKTEVYAKLGDNKTEVYAKLNSGDEYYLRLKDGSYIFAKKPNEKGDLVPYFAVKKNGKPIMLPKYSGNIPGLEYPKDPLTGDDILPEGRTNTDQYYLSFGETLHYSYPKLSSGKKFYARKRNGSFYYAHFALENGGLRQYMIENQPIIQNEEIVYCLEVSPDLETEKVIFPINQTTGDEFYLKYKNKECFGRLSNGLPVYCKKKNNYEILPKQNGVPYYIFYENRQYYPKTEKTFEYYLSIDQKQFYASNNFDQFCAKTFPDTEFLALNKKIPFYPQTKDGLELLPKAKNVQFYRIENEVEMCPMDTKTGNFYYRKNDLMDEKYPRNFSDNFEIPFPNQPPETFEYRNPTVDELNSHLRL